MKHASNVYDLENGINSYDVFPRIVTYSCDKIDAFSRIVIDGSVVRMIVIMMSHGNGISSWSGSCGICCENDFFRNDVIPVDYCCCCGESCGCDDAWSLSDPTKRSDLVKGWMHQEQAETG